MAKWLRRRIANPRSPVRVRVPPPSLEPPLLGVRSESELHAYIGLHDADAQRAMASFREDIPDERHGEAPKRAAG